MQDFIFTYKALGDHVYKHLTLQAMILQPACDTVYNNNFKVMATTYMHNFNVWSEQGCATLIHKTMFRRIPSPKTSKFPHTNTI